MNLAPIYCRLCANITVDPNPTNLFDKSNEYLIHEIRELTGMMLEDIPRQMLPHIICVKCKQDLPQACEFRKKIIRAQNFFNSPNFKSKFEVKAEHEDLKSLVEENEYTFDEMHAPDSSADDADSISDHKIFVAEFNMKKEFEELLPQIADNEAPSVSNVRSARKTRSHKSLAEKNIFKELDAATDLLQKQEKKRLIDADFEAAIESTDSDENYEHSEDEEDPEFVAPPHQLKKERLNPKTPIDKTDILENRQFKCHLCQCLIENTPNLKEHFQEQHKGQKFKCDLCEEQILSVTSFISHLKNHSGAKKNKCHYCDLTFNNPHRRLRHERRTHSKGCPFLCSICGKSFITSEQSKNHMTVHTKERAFHCKVCKVDFLLRSHLRTHYRSMTHKNNEKKLQNELSMANISEQYTESQNQLYFNL